MTPTLHTDSSDFANPVCQWNNMSAYAPCFSKKKREENWWLLVVHGCGNVNRINSVLLHRCEILHLKHTKATLSHLAYTTKRSI